MASLTEAKFVAGSFSLTINSIELNIYTFAKKKKKKKKKKNYFCLHSDSQTLFNFTFAFKTVWT